MLKIAERIEHGFLEDLHCLQSMNMYRFQFMHKMDFCTRAHSENNALFAESV